MINLIKYLRIPMSIWTIALSLNAAFLEEENNQRFHSRCITFEEINELKKEVKDKIQDFDFDIALKASAIRDAMDVFSIEDGQGGITEEGKYAQSLCAFYTQATADIYSTMINMHNSGERILSIRDAFNIATFFEQRGDEQLAAALYMYRDSKKQEQEEQRKWIEEEQDLTGCDSQED